MRKITILFIAAVVLLGMVVASVSFAEEEGGKNNRKNEALTKPTGTPHYQILNINNLWYWCQDNGSSNSSRNGDSGTYFPRGMVWLIYQDGMKWSGRCYVDEGLTQPAPFNQTIRIGGCDYGNGTLAGRINGFGATATRADPGDDDTRLYKIRRDYASMSDTERERDAAEFNEGPLSDVTPQDIQDRYDQYELDWNVWPVDYGAPYIDRNGNGEYDPPPAFSATFTVDDIIPGGYDEPGIAGGDPDSPADMVLWNVYNDLDRIRTIAMEGSEPMGLELQRTVWAYKRTDALGSMFFTQTLMLNKGGVDIDGAGGMGAFYIDSMYVCQWSDPDLGSAFDDLVGCDTTLNMGYVYNGVAIDMEYNRYGQVVPAAGYDFLAGPIVPSPGDQAVFMLKYKQDWKNLGMTGFSWFSAGSPLSDPSSDYQGGLQWDKMMRGFAPLSGPDQYYPFPPGVEAHSFPLCGDPVLQTGLVDGQGYDYSFQLGDRRLLVNCGPFTLAPRDTQQVVMALVCGQGSDRLSSVSVMKFNDRFAQNTYDALFMVTKPPMPPAVEVFEDDEKVILEWGSDLTRVADIEEKVSQPGAYKFEGYNVYQLPRQTSGLAEAVRIATYDLPTDPTVVMDEGFDPSSGKILVLPVQYGSNSGVKRYFEFVRDDVLDLKKIFNGQEYYLAVTAYAVATTPGFMPSTLEATLEVMTVVPHKESMGLRYGSSYGDTLSVTHTGTGDAEVYPIVVDAGAIEAATYSIGFDTKETWSLKKDGTVVWADKSNYSLDEVYDIADGVLLKVGNLGFATPLDFFELIAEGDGSYDIDSYYASGWEDDALALTSWGFGTTDINLLQNDLELRFTGEYDAAVGNVVPVKDGTGSIATFGGSRNWDIADHPMNPNPGSDDYFPIRIPFEVWDLDRDMQINIIVYDRVQAVTDDPFYAFNPFGRMYCWFNAKPYQETALDADNIVSDDGDYNTWNIVSWEADWKKGDVVRLNYANPIIPGTDIFTFSTSDYESSVDAKTAGEDVERISVFPNPYYAFNPAEFSRLSRFVTFTNLPQTATVRIFNLAGQLVARVDKDDASQFVRWDLLNFDGLPVASGMYIAHITVTLPTGGEKFKILKLAVVLEEEVLDVY